MPRGFDGSSGRGACIDNGFDYINVIFVAVIASLLTFSVLLLNGVVNIKSPDQYDVMNTLGLMFVLAMFLERSIDVFLSAWRSGKADLLDGKIESKENEIKSTQEQIKNSEGDLETLEKSLKEAKGKLEACINDRIYYRIGSRKWALWGGLAAGVLISAVGIRLIGSFFELGEGVSLLQTRVFHGVDMLLTGGLLAGGSNAINDMMKVYAQFLQGTRKRMK